MQVCGEGCGREQQPGGARPAEGMPARVTDSHADRGGRLISKRVAHHTPGRKGMLDFEVKKHPKDLHGGAQIPKRVFV